MDDTSATSDSADDGDVGDGVWPLRRPDSRPRQRKHRHPSPLQAALTAQWQNRFARGAVPAPAGWQADPRLCRYRSAGEALVDLRAASTPSGRVEEIASGLAGAAADGDELAGLVMVHYVLPRLVALAWGGGYGGRVTAGEERDVLDSMISTVWLSLATGEALRGPARVATRLLRDAEYQLLQRPRRRRAREEVAVARWAVTARHPADITGRPEGGVPAAEELLGVVREAMRQGLAHADAQLLVLLGVAGVPVSEAAGLDPGRVSSRCIRYRRAAALARVRSLVAVAA